MSNDRETISVLQTENERLQQRVAELERLLHESQEREQLLHEREAYLMLALSGSGDGVWDWNIQTGQIYFSPGCMEVMGYHSSEIKGHMSWWEQLVHPQDMPHVSRTLRDHLEGRVPEYQVQYRMLTRYGEWTRILSHGKVVARDKHGQPLRMAGMQTDMSRELEGTPQNIIDTLTGMFNRAYLSDALEGQIRRARERKSAVGLIMLSVDPFRFFSKVYGNDASDTLLRAVSDFLKTHIRGADIACRYNEEEFVLILPGASPENTEKRARRMCEGVHNLWVTGTGQRREIITISAGIAGFPAHGDTTEKVLNAVHGAMKLAKKEGRDRVIMASEREHM